jgi:hypothetical protein
MHLTDRRIYFTWADARRREDVTLFEDAESAQELPPPPIQPTWDPEFEVPPWVGQDGGCSFTKSVPLGADCHFVWETLGETRLSAIPWVALTSL